MLEREVCTTIFAFKPIEEPQLGKGKKTNSCKETFLEKFMLFFREIYG